jgi:hypothetical protein
MSILRTVLSAAAMLVVAAVLASCSSKPEVTSSSDPKTQAEQMVAADLSVGLGLGPLIGICNDPGPVAVGTSFACTATTETGDVVQIAGEVNDEGRIQLTTTNVVSAAALPSFEREAAASLNNSVGSNFTAEAVDCGSMSVVLGADFVLPCALMMPSSGDVFDLTLTITDLDARRFSLVVGDSPRP